MKTISPQWKQCVVLVCAQSRPDGAKKPSCGHHGSAELRAWLKTRLREEGVWGRVRVVTTSCLDVCPSRGVIVSFQGEKGDQDLRLMDAQKDRQALLEEIIALGEEEGTNSS